MTRTNMRRAAVALVVGFWLAALGLMAAAQQAAGAAGGGAGAAGGAQADAGAAGKNDDVVDAEFEEVKDKKGGNA